MFRHMHYHYYYYDCYYYFHFYFYTPGSIDPRGQKREAKNEYHWWLEVRVFVREAEGVRYQSRVEALYNHREALEQK